MTLLDGRAQFGCSLAAFADRPLTPTGLTFRGHVRPRGVDVPPLSNVVPIDPLPAWIQQGMLIVSCPACAGNPNEEFALVWLEGPHVMLCAVCGNASVGKAWRPVTLPDNLDAILTALSVRPLGNQTWMPSESVDDLIAQNVRYGWAPSLEPEAV